MKISDMQVFIIRFLLAGVLLAANMVAMAESDPFAAMDVDVPKVHMQAPAFFLDNSDGKKTALSDYAGKVVLLNFWATWCGPCRQEMPAMQKLWQRYKDQGFVILAITADRKNSRQVSAFVEKHSLSFPVLFDPQGAVRKHYEVSGLPMTYLIGRDGRIAGRSLGVREWDSDEAGRLVAGLLSQNQ